MAQGSTQYRRSETNAGSDLKDKATDQFEKLADKATDQFNRAAETVEDVAGRVAEQGRAAGQRSQRGSGQHQRCRRKIGERSADGDSGGRGRARFRARRIVEVIKRPKPPGGKAPSCFAH